MLRIVIVEDEKHGRETLKNLLLEFCKNVEIVGMAGSVEEAVEVITREKPDVVFMDIELQTGTGFEVLDRLKGFGFEVIFTTAFEQYAIKAIKFSSIDYLLKPIDLDELQQAVEKARLRKGEDAYKRQLEILLANIQPEGPKNRNICLATAEGIEFVKLQDIEYCEANGSYTNFHFRDGKKIIVSKHLKEYENLLEEYFFMRVHNSFLINMHEVKKYVKSDGGYILMNSGALVSISPKKKDEFLLKMKSIH